MKQRGLAIEFASSSRGAAADDVRGDHAALPSGEAADDAAAT